MSAYNFKFTSDRRSRGYRDRSTRYRRNDRYQRSDRRS
jgi:hypothetical protein